MKPVSGFLQREHVRLHYVDWGGDGPPLVLVHATGFHARLWDWYAERMAGRARVIAIDQRGHGDSSIPDDGFAWGCSTEDLHALIEHLGIAGCTAAGHSSGGTAAATCAGRFPGSIGALVPIDPVLPWGERREHLRSNPMAEAARRRRNVWESPHQFEATMQQREAFRLWRPEILAHYAHHGLRRRKEDHHYELKCAPESEALVFEGAGRDDPWPALESLRIPVTVLRATATATGVSPCPPGAAARIPGARELLVPTTHFIPMEAPETVQAALEAALMEREPRTTGR